MSEKSCTSVVGEIKVSKKFKSQKSFTLVMGVSNIKFNIFATGYDLVDGWKEGRTDEGWYQDG